MTKAMRSYYSERERTERAAADRAASDLTRGIHLELANRYASLARHREKLSVRF